MSRLLTHSRLQSFKRCRRRHWYEYELGWRKDTDAKALRMGTAFHEGIEALALNIDDLAHACNTVRKCYEFVPLNFDVSEWDIERETVLRLVCGYQWRWQDAKLKHVAVERSFETELRNPKTFAPAKVWRLAGKIDGIVELEDGRLAVLESKTTSDELNSDSDLWRRLRMDQQISLYVLAARWLGFTVDCVLYDVTRKPSIKPTMVPILDNLGTKIVLDSRGDRVKTKNGWRQTGDTHLNYMLQQRPMTPDEWGEKLSNDIAERPDFYFARVEIPRLDKDLEAFQSELWESQQAIRDAQRKGAWYRTVSADTCPYCPFFAHCSEGGSVDSPPIGFSVLTDVHPELGRSKQPQGNLANDNDTSPATSATESAAPEATAAGGTAS